MTQTISFPYYSIQADWNETKPGETFWLHVKDDDGKTKDFHLKVIDSKKLICIDNNDSSNESFIIENYSNRCLVIKDLKSNVSYRFLPPNKIYTSIHKKSVVTLDVAPNGLAVSASTDGTMKIWDIYQNLIKFELKGHLADVNRCRFFPSHEVILSGGSDFLVKIWSAIDGHCPVTLSGHHGSITDMAIIDRGKNIITVSRDGFAKLWSCGQRCCIEDIFDVSIYENGISSPINSCDIDTASGGIRLPERDSRGPLDEHAVGTENKILLIGTESGFIYLIGVHSKKLIFQTECHSPVNCVSFNTIAESVRLLTGTNDGKIMEFDTKNKNPLRIWSISQSPILDIRTVQRPFNGFIISRHDGSVEFFLNDNSKELIQFTGSNFDPINEISVLIENFSNIFTGSRDGNVRQYLLNNAFEL